MEIVACIIRNSYCLLKEFSWNVCIFWELNFPEYVLKMSWNRSYFCLKTRKKFLKVSWIYDYTENLYVIEEISVKNLNYIKENMMKKDEIYFYDMRFSV